MSLDLLANAYHEQLINNDKAMEHFTSKGVTRELVEEFRLGAVLEPQKEEHEPYRELPTFPYWNVKDGCTMIRTGGFMLDRVGKWRAGVMEHLFPIGDYDVQLYNVGHSLPGLRTNKVILANDIHTVLLLRGEGYRAVGVPGYQNWQRPWVELFTNSDVTMIVTPLEDEPVNAQKILDLFHKRNISSRMRLLDSSRTLAERMLDDEVNVQELLAIG